MLNYRDEVRRTCPKIDSDSFEIKLTLGAMGLAGETGEFVDLAKKHLFHGKVLDRESMLKELGDVRWYLEYLLITMGVTLPEIEEMNVKKLRARYPEGFSFDAANARADEVASACQDEKVS